MSKTDIHDGALARFDGHEIVPCRSIEGVVVATWRADDSLTPVGDCVRVPYMGDETDRQVEAAMHRAVSTLLVNSPTDRPEITLFVPADDLLKWSEEYAKDCRFRL